MPRCSGLWPIVNNGRRRFQDPVVRPADRVFAIIPTALSYSVILLFDPDVRVVLVSDNRWCLACTAKQRTPVFGGADGQLTGTVALDGSDPHELIRHR